MKRHFVNLNCVKTRVTETGEGMPLVALHGWGASHASFDELREALQRLQDSKTPRLQIRLIAPDLPGCGESEDPPNPWNVDDYVQWLKELLREMRLTGYYLLGHSHGGRIAIAYAAEQPPGLLHLYLCAAAGVGREIFLRKTFWPAMAKWGNAVLSLPGLKLLKPLTRRYVYKFLGVHDYERANPVMKKTMAGVIESDLMPILAQIEAPTDIFWGEDDTTTPLQIGHVMEERIAGSRIHVFPGVRHRVHIERAKEIAGVIQAGRQVGSRQVSR
jgi:pimeloyl-ACP methyl ester carboxylesterase